MIGYAMLINSLVLFFILFIHVVILMQGLSNLLFVVRTSQAHSHIQPNGVLQRNHTHNKSFNTYLSVVKLHEEASI